MFSYLKRDKDFYYNIVRLAVPIILQNLVTSSLGLVDTSMVGLLPGGTAMAAVTLANIPIFTVQLIIFGLQSGASVLISQFWGKGDTDSISRILGIGIYTAVAISIPFALITFFLPVPFLHFFSNNTPLVSLAADYARIVGFSYLFSSVSQVYLGAQRSMENPDIGLYVSCVSMFSNTFLNWVFIFGMLGAPAMGIKGAALATLLSRVLEFIITCIYAVNSRYFLIRAKFLLFPGHELLCRYIRYSSPVVVNETLFGLGTALYPTIMGHMAESTEILTAYTVAGNIDHIYTVAVFAIANTAAIIVGREIGAGHLDEVYDVGAALNTVAFGTGLVLGAAMIVATKILIAPYIYPLFKLSPRAAAISTMMQVVTSAFLAMRAFNCSNIVGILRGGGDVRSATIIDLFPLWFIALPLSALLGLVLKFDIFWVFLCITAENFIKLILGLIRFRTRAWIRDVTQADCQI